MNTQTTEPKGAESSHSPSIGPDIILCKIPHCNKGFSEPIQLRRHEKSDHDDSSLLKYHTAKSHKLKCPHNHCHSHKTYWTKRSLVKHIKIHTDEGKKTAAKATREYRCLDCKVDFQSLYDLDRHIKSTVHFKPSTTPTVESVGAALNSCIPCNRKFKNSSALQMHMESSRHKPLTPGLTCIRPGCGRKFNSPSAMLHHVESGGCSPDMDRNFVNRMIVQNDPNGIITDHEAAAQADPEYGLGLSIPRAIANDSTARVGEIHVEDCDSETEADVIPTPTDTWGDDDSDDGDYGGVQILTPGTNTSGDSTPVANNNALIFTPQSGATSGIITPIGPRFTRSRIFPEYLQSRKLILLSAQQSGETHVACPLCVKRKKFTIPQLELHLMSAAHAPKIFHCPISILDAGKKDKHMRSFSTLSGLTQHVESEACKGGKVAFEKVVRFVEGKLRELGFENGFGLDLLQKGGFGGLIEA
ncbi:hypothetical protein DFH27DRAFT_614547 [Peziza echinospora]|nr:hypothetical protein DFH27DRAFT_614547 [Peziza echinospora]